MIINLTKEKNSIKKGKDHHLYHDVWTIATGTLVSGGSCYNA